MNMMFGLAADTALTTSIVVNAKSFILVVLGELFVVSFVIFGSVACSALDGDDQGGGRGRERTDPVGSERGVGTLC